MELWLQKAFEGGVQGFSTLPSVASANHLGNNFFPSLFQYKRTKVPLFGMETLKVYIFKQ